MLDKRHVDNAISVDQLRQFNDLGWLLVPNALSFDLVKKLEGLIDDIHANHIETGFDPYRQAPLDASDNFFYPDFLGKHQHFINLLDCPKTFPLVWGILGWNIYCYHSHFIISPPQLSNKSSGLRSLGWHQDSLRLNREVEGDPRPRFSIKVVFWLSDCSEPDRGNFYIVPGSHLSNKLKIPEDGNLPKEAIPVLAKAGDAVLFDRRLWHARSENYSSITRKGLFYGYGYRWLRPKDEMTIPNNLMERNDPIRQQLLGDSYDNNSRYGNIAGGRTYPPLKIWLDERGIKYPWDQ